MYFKTILVIVPDLPPNVNGVGDFASMLYEKFNFNKQKFDIQFLIAGNIKYDIPSNLKFRIRVLRNQSPVDLFNILLDLDCCLVHLHYVGYGYAKRGAPFWLFRALELWKKRINGIIIITFHELYAFSFRPWTSSFYNQISQRIICKRLAKLSDTIVTSSEVYIKKLKNIVPNAKIYHMPVFSNIGEMLLLNNLSDRQHQIVVFGSSSNRYLLYEKYFEKIEFICNQFNIYNILDIGPDIQFCINHERIKIKKMGVLPMGEIQTILADSFIGLIGNYDNKDFAKSGVFAAFAANGILIINLNKSFSSFDGLIVGQHYLDYDSNANDPSIICKLCYNWYLEHSLSEHVKMYTEILNCYLC